MSRMGSVRRGCAGMGAALALSALQISPDLAAQAVGVSPHVGPVNPIVQPGFNRSPGSPQMNVPDGEWNNGEAFRSNPLHPDADYGGHLGYADPTYTGQYEYKVGVTLDDVFHIDQSSGGTATWKQTTFLDPRRGISIALWTFVGYLRPAALGPYIGSTPGTVKDAAFELFFPVNLPNDQVPTLVLQAWATTGKPPLEQGGRSAYPGLQRADGLVGTPTQVLRHADPAIAGLAAAQNQLVITGYIVPRVFGRASVFELQRIRELRQVMRLMLAAPLTDPRHPPGLPVIPLTANDVPCMVSGGSFGGLTGQELCLRYPADFNGAAISVFGCGARRVLADQFNLDYFVTRGGFSVSGGAYGLEDTLEWATALRWMDQNPGQNGWDFFDASPLLRWRRGELYCPLVWRSPDEDTIGHGTDTLSLITGLNSYLPRFRTSGLAFLAFSAVDRRCHDDGWFTTAINGTPNAWHASDQAVELVAHAAAAKAAYPNPPSPLHVGDDGSEDAYAWVQDRVLPAAHNPGANDPLLLDPNFGNPSTPGRTHGAGLALGRDESLRFAVVPTNNGTASQPSVFCGGAEGVVSRYVLDPASQELVVVAQSEVLGLGAFALAVGELSDGHSGLEVVVGTKDHVFVLDAETLALLNHAPMPMGFEHVRPRRMQIADVFSGPDYPGNEIILTTLSGHLLVSAGDDALSTMTDLGEPGIQDFAVLEGAATPSVHTTSNTPVILLSHRGHMIHVTLNKSPDPTARNPHPAEVQAWTPGEHGGPADLEIVAAPNGGAPVAVALYEHPGQNLAGTVHYPQIRCFDAMTLQAASTVGAGLPDGLRWIGLGTSGTDVTALDLAPVHTSGGALAGFVVLTGSRIAFVPANGSQPGGQLPAGYKLDGFAPAANALAIVTADIATRAGGETYREEIILSTLAGQVVWIHLEDMLASANGEYLDFVGAAPNPAPPPAVTPHANRTLAGQWGLVAHDIGAGVKLFGASQCGRLFATDPLTGVGILQDVYREAGETLGFSQRKPTLVISPIRDLALLGSGVTQSSNPSEVEVRTTTTPNSTLRWFRTQPWENLYNDVMNPFWVRGDISVQVSPTLTITLNRRPGLPVAHGLAALVGGGASYATGHPVAGATRQLHCWGGSVSSMSDLIQGVYANASQVVDNWASSNNVPAVRTFDPNQPWLIPAPVPPQQSWRGRGSTDCKDLRNEVRAWSQSHQMQSLRVGTDAFADAPGGGPVIVASTIGGSVVLMRGGSKAGLSDQDYGRILWDSADPAVPWDEGLFAMGLALRSVPGDPNGALDVFVGIGVTHLDPAAWQSNSGPGQLTGAIVWYRWVATSPTQGTMTRIGLLPLVPNATNAIGARGGFGVCGLAVGDVLSNSPGDELIATTMEGDLFVFAIPGAGMLGAQHLLYRTWVQGALGVSNAIVALDADNDSRNELYIAGSLGIWKWKQR